MSTSTVTATRGRRASAKQIAEFILELRQNGVNPFSVTASRDGINVVLRSQGEQPKQSAADKWIKENAGD